MNKVLKKFLLFFELSAIALIVLKILINNRVVDIICSLEVFITCIIHIIYHYRVRPRKKKNI